MKKVFWLMGSAFLLITACIVYLIINGVSLRSAPYIKPTPVQEGVIGSHVHLRLFSDWKNVDYVFWQYNPESPHFALEESTRLQILELLKNQTQIQMNIAASDQASDLQNCPRPCFVNTVQAHQLSPNPVITEWIQSSKFITVSWLYFDRDVQVPQSCVELKRLTLDCITPLVVHQNRKKMKLKDAKYFLMNKYLDQDYFIFVENK